MAFQKYVQINNKKYRVIDNGQWQPTIDRQKTYEVGLTGVSIIQDFTRADGAGGEREPQFWVATLRVFIDEPWPDNSYGNWSDLLAASRQPFVDFVEHDDTKTHKVGIHSPLIPLPRVGANIEGHCYGEFWVDVKLEKIYEVVP